MLGIETLLILLAAVGGTSTVVGVTAWIFYRLKRLEDAGLPHAEALKQLRAEVVALREELEADRSRIHELAERADFAARLLDKGGSAGELPPGGADAAVEPRRGRTPRDG